MCLEREGLNHFLKIEVMARKITYFIILVLSLFFTIILLHNSFIIVKGGSMEPTLYNNDLLIVTPKDPNQIKIGDIVVISSPNYYFENGGAPIFSNLENQTKIVHRVVDKKQMNGTWFFLTKGDNNILIDGSIICLNRSENYAVFEYNTSNGVYIPETAIESVMLFKIPFLGYIQDFSMIILIGNGIIVIAYFYVKKKGKIVKATTRKNLLRLLTRVKYLLCILVFLFLILITSIMLNKDIFFMNNNSMAPSFYKNDILIRENVDPVDISVNDVVIIRSPKYYYEQGFDPIFWNFYPNSSYLVHRIAEKRKINDTWFFVTQGDRSQWKPDGIFKTLVKTGDYDYFKFELNKTNCVLITKEAILGVVVAKIPLVGFLFKSYISILSVIFILMIQKKDLIARDV